MKRHCIRHRQKADHDRFSICLIFLLLIGLGVILTGCRAADALPSTPTVSQTKVPTASVTVRPSHTALPTQTTEPARTSTPAASFTPTDYPTATPYPTATRLVPIQEAGQAYQLTDWTVKKAQQLLNNLITYPDTLAFYDRGWMDTSYYSSMKYAGLAELETVLRFPETSLAAMWRANGAFDLYQSNNKDAGHLITALITDALNSRETTLQDLENWCSEYFPFRTHVYINTPPAGYQNSLVLHLFIEDGGYVWSGLAIWLLQKGETYLGYALDNWTGYPHLEDSSVVELVDLTGDGIQEAIIQNIDWGSFSFHSGNLSIYRLDQAPPQKITWSLEIDDLETAIWSVDHSANPPFITFSVLGDTEGSMPCMNFYSNWQYRWNNNRLEFVKFIPPDTEEMEQNPICTRLMVAGLGESRLLEYPQILETFTRLLDLPFIKKTEAYMGSGPWIIETQRLYLAAFLSDHGDQAGAAQQIAMIEASVDPDVVTWRQDALASYAARDDDEALMRLCKTTDNCDFDLSEKIQLVPPGRFSEMDSELAEMGESIYASGFYDFDLDGVNEYWVIPWEEYSCSFSLFIAGRVNEQILSRDVRHYYFSCEITVNDPVVEITALPPSTGILHYQISLDAENGLAFDFLYWPLGYTDPTVSVSLIDQTIDEIQNQLLLRQITPNQAKYQLIDQMESPVEPEYWKWFDQSKAHALYLIGLCHELNGAPAKAAQTYLQLWQTYPQSPYALMAYAKLERAL